MNYRIRAVRVLANLMVMAVAAAAMAAGSQEITAKGYATIYGKDTAAARDRAIEDAQRNAVEQAIGTMISSESVTRNFQLIDDRILSLSSGYIENYRVLSETEKEDELEVEIAATVGMRKLGDSLQAIKSLIRRMDKPKLMILIAEQAVQREGSEGQAALSAASLGISETAVIEHFRAKGFDFVDRQALAGQIEVADPMKLVGDSEHVRTIANLTDAQVVIFGQAQSRSGAQLHGIHSGQADISLRALKADTGEIIAATRANAAVPHVNPATANTRALAKASQDISCKLMDQILKQWQAESGGTRNIALSVSGVTYGEAKKFRAWLPVHVRGVKDVHQRAVQNNTAELDIDLEGSAESLADELSEKTFENRSIEVTDLLPNKIGIELKPEAP